MWIQHCTRIACQKIKKKGRKMHYCLERLLKYICFSLSIAHKGEGTWETQSASWKGESQYHIRC